MLWYEINQSYIIEELCIQKEIKDNTCQGNCELSAKLELTESKNTDNNAEIVTEFEVNVFLVSKTISCLLESAQPINYQDFLVIKTVLPYVDEHLRPPIIS